MNPIATVTQVNLFPVKSMRGTSVEQADLWWYGLEGDRKCAFVQSDSRLAFPWLTEREYPDLVRYAAYYADASTVQQNGWGPYAWVTRFLWVNKMRVGLASAG